MSTPQIFAPQKLITLGVALILLAPFGYLFWRIAAHRARPEAEVRAELEEQLRQQGGSQASVNAEGGETIRVLTGVAQVEAIGFFKSTRSWLSFFPRPWVGVLGLLALACIVVCLIVSLFIRGGVEVGLSELPMRK